MSVKQTKAVQNVQYNNTSRVHNADQQLNAGSSTAKIEKTHSATQNLPLGQNQGIILGVQSEPARQTGYQLFMNKNGELATRYIDEDNSRNNSGWKTILDRNHLSNITYSKSESDNKYATKQELQSKQLDHYFKKPEYDSPVSNIDSILDSGIQRTDTNTQGSFPTSVGGNKQGIIQTFKDDTSGFSLKVQLFISLGSAGRGIIHTRTANSSGWSQWATLDPNGMSQGGQTSNPNDYLSNIGVINNIDTSFKIGAGYTTSSTQGTFPFSNDNTGKHGVCMFYPEGRKSESAGSGVQIYIAQNGNNIGKMFVRVHKDNRWQQWKEIGGISQSEADNRYIIQSQLDRIEDANNFPNRSLTAKTDTQTTGLPITGKYGIIEIYYQNSSNKTGFQRWTCISDDCKGRSWVRGIQSGQKGEWIETTKDLSNVFTHPTSTPHVGDVKTLGHGVVLTGNQTLGLPTKQHGFNEVSKKGVLKTVVYDAHNKVQYYTPIEGSFKGKTFTRVIDPTSRGLEWVNWDLLSMGAGHLRVADARGQTTMKPQDFIQHDNHDSGYTLYMEAFTNQLGITSEPTGRATVQTVVPWKKDTYENATSGATGDITQIAYVNDGKIFIRHGGQDAQTWQPWKEIGLQNTAIIRPEEQNNISDANHVPASGIYTTTPSNPMTANLPAGVDNYTGSLTYYQLGRGQDPNAIEFWTGVAGNAENRTWTRTRRNQQPWSEWKEIGSGGGGSSIDFNTWYN